MQMIISKWFMQTTIKADTRSLEHDLNEYLGPRTETKVSHAYANMKHDLIKFAHTQTWNKVGKHDLNKHVALRPESK